MVRRRSVSALLLAAAAVGSLSAQPAGPAFEVVSVKRNIGGRLADIRLDFLPNRLIVRGVPLRWVIAAAYIEAEPEAVVLERVLGGPAWIDTDSFDIDGVPAAETSGANMRVMLRRLLQERFNLAIRSEARPGPAYAVTLNRADGRPGPQLREPVPECNGTTNLAEARRRRCGTGVYFDKEDQSVVVYGADSDVDTILASVSRPTVVKLDRPLVNRTGLSGRFSFELRFSRDATASVAASGTSFFTALQQQLGFKAEPVTAPREVFVIDSVQQPTQN